MKISLPNNVSFHTTLEKTPFKNIRKIPKPNVQYKGIISKDGKWIGNPIGSWALSHPAIGDFKIKHLTGYKYYSLSFDPMGAQGIINIIKSDEYDIEIKITDGKDPIDIDFAICFTATVLSAG